MMTKIALTICNVSLQSFPQKKIHLVGRTVVDDGSVPVQFSQWANFRCWAGNHAVLICKHSLVTIALILLHSYYSCMSNSSNREVRGKGNATPILIHLIFVLNVHPTALNIRRL